LVAGMYLCVTTFHFKRSDTSFEVARCQDVGWGFRIQISHYMDISSDIHYVYKGIESNQFDILNIIRLELGNITNCSPKKTTQIDGSTRRNPHMREIWKFYDVPQSNRFNK
jgi:hypothetical protein